MTHPRTRQFRHGAATAIPRPAPVAVNWGEVLGPGGAVVEASDLAEAARVALEARRAGGSLEETGAALLAHLALAGEPRTVTP